MLAYARGDEAAFDELFARFRDRVYTHLARTVGDRNLAADLLQQVFLRVHQARGRYDPSRSFAAWLFAIAANLRKDEHKKAAHRAAAILKGIPQPIGTVIAPDVALEGDERRRRLEEALMQLPETQREVILLHKIEGLSFPEIAAALGKDVEAVKSRAFRGYRALRRALEATWNG